MIRPRTSSSKLRPYLLALLTLPALLLSASPTEAALIAAFTGNTRPSDPGVGTTPGVDGTINFAVFDRTGGTTNDPFGVGGPNSTLNLASIFVAGTTVGGGTTPGPALATGSQFLYLFQTVNDSFAPTNNTNPISENSVNVLNTSITSFGRFTALGFVDAQGAINGSTNPFLGAVAAAASDPSPAVLGVTGVTAAPTSPASEPDQVVLGPNSLRAVFTTTPPALVAGQISSIWGYTSNFAPTFPANTGIIDGGTTADGRVPTAGVVPEPSTLLMGAMAVPALLICLRRKSKAAV